MASVKPFVEDFLSLFKGNQESHGVHYPETTTKEGEKAAGKSLVVHEAVTEDIVTKHLHGKQGLGIVPIDHKNKVNFAVIDVDVYPTNPKKYIDILHRAGIPAVCFRSKSGGLHVFLFFSDEPEASKIRPSLMKLVGMLGLPQTVEVFPKQTMLEEGKTGNWINLPYFNYDDTARYAYDSEAKPLSLKDAIIMIKGVRQPWKQFVSSINGAPMAQGPPCLQTIYLAGGAGEGERNHYLFNCAGYLKARYKEDYEEHVHSVNERMDDPIPFTELNKTVIASHNKSNYTYDCKSPVLAEHCNKEECSCRPFGITSDNVTSINFGQLTQYAASEPYYEWEINGKTLRFDDAKALESQSTFRTLCLKELHLPQHRMKESKWVEVLKTAMDNITVEEPSRDEISDDNLWIHRVTQFIQDNQTANITEVADGKVFYSDSEIVFKAMALAEYLQDTRAFMSFAIKRHNDMIRNTLGGTFKNITRKGFKGRVVILKNKELRRRGVMMDVRDKKAFLREIQKEGANPISYLDEHRSKF